MAILENKKRKFNIQSFKVFHYEAKASSSVGSVALIYSQLPSVPPGGHYSNKRAEYCALFTVDDTQRKRKKRAEGKG